VEPAVPEFDLHECRGGDKLGTIRLRYFSVELMYAYHVAGADWRRAKLGRDWYSHMVTLGGWPNDPC